MPIEQVTVPELDVTVDPIADEDLFYMVDMDGNGGQPIGRKVRADQISEYLKGATASQDLWVVKRAVYRNLATDVFGDQATNFAGTGSSVAATANNPLMGDVRTTTTIGNVAGLNGITQFLLNRRLWASSISQAVNSDSRYWMATLTSTTGATLGGSATPAAPLIGFRYDPTAGDSQWMFCHSDGVSFSATTTGVAPDFVTPQLFEYRLLNSGLVNVYINRALCLSGVTPLTPTSTAFAMFHTVTNLVGAATKSVRYSQHSVAQFYM